MRLELRIAESDIRLSAPQAFFYMMLMAGDNMGFLCNNYIPLTVKGIKGRHIDFEFDGIYDCRETPFEKLTVIGKYSDVCSIIDKALSEGIYTVITENQAQNRDYGDVDRYNNFWLVYGLDDIKGVYLVCSYGTEHRMEFGEVACGKLEEGYMGLEAEWDFELYMFRPKKGCPEEPHKREIRYRLEEYLAGSDILGLYTSDFFKGKIKDHEVRISFAAKSGINVYDFLRDSVKEGFENTRSFEALFEHKLIVQRIYEAVLGKEYENIAQEAKELTDCAGRALSLAHEYMASRPRKTGKVLSGIIKDMRQRETVLMKKIILLIDN